MSIYMIDSSDVINNQNINPYLDFFRLITYIIVISQKYRNSKTNTKV